MTCSKYSSTNRGSDIGKTSARGRGLADRSGIGASFPAAGLLSREPSRGARPLAGGLDLIEDKKAPGPAAGLSSTSFGRLTAFVVGVLFTAVFVLGCLTLQTLY